MCSWVTNLEYVVNILKEYVNHWQQIQEQDLAKEREVAENLKLQQTEQARRQDITANDNEEEERHDLMRLMLNRNKKNQSHQDSCQALAIQNMEWCCHQRECQRKVCGPQAKL